MSQSETYPNGFLLGIDNKRRKLDLLLRCKSNRAEHRGWCMSRPDASLSAIIDRWLKQNILPKNNLVDLYKKGLLIVGFDSIVRTLDKHEC